MDIEIAGKRLAELSPAAADYFKTAETVRWLGVVALADAVLKISDEQLRESSRLLKAAAEDRAQLVQEIEELIVERDELKARLSRPRNGGNMAVKVNKRVVPAGTDETTKDLLDEAYNGKKPHSKSEARRLAVQRGDK